MKRLFRKDNRIARLVALWLVFIMALTPLYQHSGLKNPTKAESGVIEYTLNVSTETIVTDGVQVTYDADNNKYVIGGNGADHKMYYFSTSGANVAVTAVVNGNLKFVGPDATVYPTYQYGVLKCSSGTTPSASMTDSEASTAGLAVKSDTTTTTLNVAPGESYAIYVKVDEFTYTNGTDETTGAPITVDASATNNTWELLTAYTLTQQTSLLSSGATILSSDASGTNVSTGKVYKELYLTTKTNENATEEGNLYIGDIELYYGKKSGTNSAVSQYDLTTMKKATPGTQLDTATLGDGEYIAFIVYKADSDEDITYINSGEPTTAKVDTTAPAIKNGNGYPYMKDLNAPWTETGLLTKEDGVYYLDVNSASGYQFGFVVTDSNLTSPLRVYATKVDDSSTVIEYSATGNGTYTVSNILVDSSSAKVPEGTYELKVDLKDAAGNEKLGESLDTKFTIYDPSLKVTVNGSSSNVALTTPTKEKENLTVYIESGDTLSDFIIFDSEGTAIFTEADFSTEINSVSKTGGLYKYTFTVPFPKSVVDVKYEELKLQVTDAGKSSLTINLYDPSGTKEYVYDATPPVLKANGAKKGTSGSNDFEAISDDDISGNKIVVTEDSENTDAYQFYYTATDATTEVKNVYYYFTNQSLDESKTLSKDNGEYYIEISNSDLYTYLNDNSLTEMYIYAVAEDTVGNRTEPVEAAYVVACPNTKIDIKGVLVKADGTSVDLSGSYIVGAQCKLKLTISSGYYIDSIVLSDNDGNALATLNNFTSDQCTFNNADKRWYLVDQYIPLPEDVTSNILLEGLTVTVTDIGVDDGNGGYTINPQDDTKDVGTLLYDSSKPTMTMSTKKAGEADFTADTALTTDNTWYKSGYTFEAIFVPGEQTTESKVDVTKYEITNSKSDTSGAVTNDNVKLPWNVNGSKVSTVIPESKTSAGTKVTFTVLDEAGNEISDKGNTIVRRVDGSAPSVDAVLVNGEKYNGVPVSGTVRLSAQATDNLALGSIKIEVANADNTVYYTNPSPSYAAGEALNENSTSVTGTKYLDVTLPDGEYTITVKAVDKAGWESAVSTSKFTVDSTAPVVTAAISSGTAGKTDYFYQSNVTVALTCTEKNSSNIVVTDNGTPISVTWNTNPETGIQEATYTVSADGLHTIKINATDATGNAATEKSVAFIKDTKAPTISAMFNGAINYNESDGVRVFTADTTLAFSESDDNKDLNGFYYQMTKQVPDETAVVGKSAATAYRSFTYTEEAEYTVNVYSVDMANNTSATRTVRFRIDKTAPNISIGGIASGGTSSSAVTVSLNMQELYWSDATGTVEIYMKAGEGFGEELVETINYTPTGRNTTLARTFSESGIYRIEFNAQDSAGHTATASSSFTIDTDAPVVTLEGVKNYDVTDQSVTVTSTITEKFYASKKVTVTGTVTDEAGKVTPLTIDNYNPTANPTTISETFTADGIYDLTISCVDVAGNSHSQSVHFTIDKSDPVIGDLSDIDGKILTSFSWDKDLDELVSDLTVCDVHMYLNGQEYNGEDTVEDGTYVLLITAEDELGHTVEKEVKFTLDTKAPVFIVTGVEDKESRIEPYTITVSLQLEEDTLTSVTLNGEVKTITNNTVTFEVTEVGEYKLYMEAIDEAGNVSSAEYEFELESESQFNIWILIAILALLLIIIIIIILKKRNKDKK